jgi:hypothetical protein
MEYARGKYLFINKCLCATAAAAAAAFCAARVGQFIIHNCAEPQVCVVTFAFSCKPYHQMIKAARGL